MDKNIVFRRGDEFVCRANPKRKWVRDIGGFWESETAKHGPIGDVTVRNCLEMWSEDWRLIPFGKANATICFILRDWI